jgi:hypothetical protein
MKRDLVAIEEQLDPLQETKFCINASREFIEKERKEEFLNKLTFQYTLNKINKEKYSPPDSECTASSSQPPPASTRGSVSVLPRSLRE